MPGNADSAPLHPGDDVFGLSPSAVAGDRLTVPAEVVTRTAVIRVRPIPGADPNVTEAIAAKNARSVHQPGGRVRCVHRAPQEPQQPTRWTAPTSTTGNPSSVAITVAKTVDCTTCANGWPAPGSVASEIDLSNSVTRKPTPWLERRHRPSINPAEKAAASSAARTERAPRALRCVHRAKPRPLPDR
jgi:hypothetical protein